MKAGQITAKLRDAVPVHFFEDGEDRIQYRNIDIPDSLKTLEIMDFAFDIAAEATDTQEQPERMEARFNVTGDRRKALVAAVRDFIRWEPVCKGAPSFAYAVGDVYPIQICRLILTLHPVILTA